MNSGGRGVCVFIDQMKEVSIDLDEEKEEDRSNMCVAEMMILTESRRRKT